MRPDPRGYLWDARRAGELVQSFVGGRTWADYQGDAMLRSAVERQLAIVGEALNRLRQSSEELSALVPDVDRIVAFRNVLVHGYAKVNDRVVWDLAVNRVEAPARHPLHAPERAMNGHARKAVAS